MADVAIRTSPSGIAVIDLDGMLVYNNPALCRLFGHDGESLAGSNLAGLFSDPEITQSLLAAISEGKDWNGRVECLRDDGSRVVAECDAAGNSNSDGDLIGAVLSFTDMTDRLRVAKAEQTIERNRVMMASLGSICHHLGQPSTVLLNCMELLQRMDDGEKEQRKELLDLSLSAAESITGCCASSTTCAPTAARPIWPRASPTATRSLPWPAAPTACGPTTMSSTTSLTTAIERRVTGL